MVDIHKDDVNKVLNLLPTELRSKLLQQDLSKLIEIVLDLGRAPEARFAKKKTLIISDKPITAKVIDDVVSKIGDFNSDNRAGLEGTLHRISCIRNRRDKIIGLTMRIGRSIFGTIEIIRDSLDTGKSVLLLGAPGVGKTTMLREIAHCLSTDKGKRVVIIDTSNEIAGDGDVPHPAIGRARRMQVSREIAQHDVMIEAVENHTPEVIIIDEIGTEAEAAAARTIAERGVSLIGTAHGITLENLIKNPTLSDLIGGIQSVTLGDEEARKRGTRKSILERAAKPTFDICVEIIDKFTCNVHEDVAENVDALLRGWMIHPETRKRDKETDVVEVLEESKEPELPKDFEGLPCAKNGVSIALYPYAISKGLIRRAIEDSDMDLSIANSLDEADAILALKSYAEPGAKIFEIAEKRGVPVKLVSENSIASIIEAIDNIINEDLPEMECDWSKLVEKDPKDEGLEVALSETLEAINECLKTRSEPTITEPEILLTPQDSYIRKKQHELINKYNLNSKSVGIEPMRRVVIDQVS